MKMTITEAGFTMRVHLRNSMPSSDNKSALGLTWHRQSIRKDSMTRWSSPYGKIDAMLTSRREFDWSDGCPELAAAWHPVLNQQCSPLSENPRRCFLGINWQKKKKKLTTKRKTKINWLFYYLFSDKQQQQKKLYMRMYRIKKQATVCSSPEYPASSVIITRSTAAAAARRSMNSGPYRINSTQQGWRLTSFTSHQPTTSVRPAAPWSSQHIFFSFKLKREFYEDLSDNCCYQNHCARCPLCHKKMCWVQPCLPTDRCCSYKTLEHNQSDSKECAAH